jgi:hypothetical protein
MAKVEIDEAQLAVLNRAMTVLDNVNKNPAARRKMEAAFKEIDPNLETEEDIANRHAGPIKAQLDEERAARLALEKKFEDQLAAAAQREEVAQSNAALDRIRVNYSDDAMDRIKQIMVDRKIADPEAAALVFDKLNPPAPQITTSSYESEFYDMAPAGASVEDTRLLFSNPDAWEDKMIKQVLIEERRVAA